MAISEPRPDDACPYARPFPPGFAGCPTYQGQDFLPMTSFGEALTMSRSCAHLKSGEQDRGRFYGRCTIGTEEDRRLSVELADRSRLERLRSLRHELRNSVTPQVHRLLELNGRRRASLRRVEPESDRRYEAELAEACEELVAAVDAYARAHPEPLQELGMEPADVTAMVRHLSHRYIAGDHSGDLPPALSQRVPVELAASFVFA